MKSCIIIGAGLAGLAAAYRLKKRKKPQWDVKVVEARSEVGGRVFSHWFKQEPSLVCELGAEWIGTSHDSMRRLCKEFHLPLQKHQFGYRFSVGGRPSKLYRPGDWSFSAKAEKKFNDFGDEFKKVSKDSAARNRALDRLDWWSKLRELDFSRQELERRDLMDSTDSGESIRHASAYSAAAEYFPTDGNKTDEMDDKICGGNILLPRALARFIGEENIFRGSKVSEIWHAKHQVFVRFPGHKPLQADFCICTVPARSLTRIEFHPRLPREHVAAAEQLQYCRIMKTAVLYPSRFWGPEKDLGFSVFTSGVSDFCFHSTFRQQGQRGILCSYAVGDKADDLASEPKDKVAGWITQDVASVVGSEPGKYIDLKKCAWQEDDYTQGAYAFYRPGQWFTIRPILKRPHHRVFFAGEHLADEQGFMEGAVDSGEKAAGAVIRRAGP